jgi:hypothetical protein
MEKNVSRIVETENVVCENNAEGGGTLVRGVITKMTVERGFLNFSIATLQTKTWLSIKIDDGTAILEGKEENFQEEMSPVKLTNLFKSGKIIAVSIYGNIGGGEDQNTFMMAKKIIVESIEAPKA